MLARFRAPRERAHVGTIDEVVTVLRQFEAAGVTRIYVQHPDRQDFVAARVAGRAGPPSGPLVLVWGQPIRPIRAMTGINRPNRTHRTENGARR